MEPCPDMEPCDAEGLWEPEPCWSGFCWPCPPWPCPPPC